MQLMDTHHNTALSNVIDVIRRFKHVERIILFGSYANKTAHENSDIDLAIIAPDIKPVNWQTLVSSAERAADGIPLDINRVDQAGDYLLETIAKDGVVIFNRDT
jgi:predicted nucleotidyltransferase